MPRFSAKNANSEVMDTHTWDEARSLDREKALGFVITWLESREKDLKIVGVGHRVVQGGPYNKPVLVDEAVLQELRKLEAITPSHQPFDLEGIRTLVLPWASAPSTVFQWLRAAAQSIPTSSCFC